MHGLLLGFLLGGVQDDVRSKLENRAAGKSDICRKSGKST